MKNQNDIDIYKEYHLPSRLKKVSDEMNLQIEKMWCEIIAGDNSQIYDFYEIHIPIMYYIMRQIALTANNLLVERGVTIEDFKQELYIFNYEFIERYRKRKNNIKGMSKYKTLSIQSIIMRELQRYLFRKVLYTNHKPGWGDVLNEHPDSLDEPSPFTKNGDGENKINFVEYKNICVFSSPEYNILTKERSLMIANKINELSDDLKKVLILYYFKNKSYKEVCEICGFSKPTFSSKSRKILAFFRSDKDFTNYFDELKTKGFSAEMSISNGVAKCIRSDAENELFVSDVCKVLLENNGDIKKTLTKLKGKYFFLTFTQINLIKNKCRYTSISDKFFPKNYFAEYDKLRYTKKYDLYDKDMKFVKHFDKIKDISAYLHSSDKTVKKYSKANALFKNMYYIKECE